MRGKSIGLTSLRMDALEHRDAPTVVPIGSEFRVNAVTSWFVDEPAVALDGDGDFVVAWQAMDADGSDNAVFFRRYSKDGVALSGDVQVNTYTIGSQQRPAIAADAVGNFVVVWGSASAQDGSREGVYARRFDMNGQPLSGEFRINQFTLDIQGNPSVAMDGDGDFVVTWESNYQDGDGYAIYARRYNNAGQPTGNEFQVNSITTGDQRYPAVALSSIGTFVITWQGPDQDLDGVFARRFGGDGLPVGPEFQVNSTTSNDQARPKVAADAVGNFAIAWESNGQDSGTTGIYARRFSFNGTPLATEFRVNSFTSYDQTTPRIASNAGGDLIVTWQSNQQDGNLGGIFGQRIGSNGAFSGSEFRINTTTFGDQVRPALGIDNYGDFVIAWPSNGTLSDGIYSQRYYRPPIPQVNVQIDDGNSQRSSIRDITLSFNTLVTIAPGAVTLTGPVGPVSLIYDDISSLNQTIIRLRFQGASSFGGSLINGNYQLNINHQFIANYLGELLDSNNDGLPGPDVTTSFHRLFGDGNGDRIVSASDFQIMHLFYGYDSSHVYYRHYFDYDGDGSTSAVDFSAFRIAYGTTLAP